MYGTISERGARHRQGLKPSRNITFQRSAGLRAVLMLRPYTIYDATERRAGW